MFVLLCRPRCPQCDKARRILREMGYPYRCEYPSAAALQQRTGRASYPQVYDGARLVGGPGDLERYLGLALVPAYTQKPCCYR
jgi:glutaredoxin